MKLTLSVSKTQPKSKADGGSITDFVKKEFDVTTPDEILKSLFTTRNYSTNYWIDGKCKKTNYLGLFGITLDVDKDISLADAKELFKEYNCIIHTSTSHRKDKGDGAKDRFRVILPFHPSKYDAYDSIRAQAVYGIILKKYTFIDSTCAELGRKYYPFLNIEYPQLFELYVTDTGKYYEITDTEISDFIVAQEASIPQNKPTPVDGVDDPSKKYIHLDDELESQVIGKFKIRDVTPDIEVKSVFCPFCNDRKTVSSSAHITWTRDKKILLYCDGCEHDGVQYRYFLPLTEQYANIFYIENKLYAVKTTEEKITVGMIPEAMLSHLGKDTSAVLKNWIANNRRFNADEVQLHRKCDGYANKNSWNLTDTGNLYISMAPVPTKIKDNDYVNNWLLEVFGSAQVQSAKYLLMSAAYFNFRRLPVVILMGPRNVGKSTFAETMGSMFPDSYMKWEIENSSQFNAYLEKRVVLVDEVSFSNKKGYDMFKAICGEKQHLINKKFKNPFNTLNNTIFCLASNDFAPLYFKDQELPNNEKDNQWMVLEVLGRPGDIDAFKSGDIMDRMGWYIRTELRDLYEKYVKETDNGRTYRYTIPVPVTDLLKEMFANSKSNLDYLCDSVHYALVNGANKTDIAGNSIKRVPINLCPSIPDLSNVLDALRHPNQNVKSVRERMQDRGLLKRRSTKNIQGMDAWDVIIKK
jgi:Family of unknown function (DUF5906)